MRRRRWLALIPAMALAGGACSSELTPTGAGGGAGPASAGSGGALGTGGEIQGAGGATGGAGAVGHGATISSGGGHGGVAGQGVAGRGAFGGQAGHGAGAAGASGAGMSGAADAGPGGAGGQAPHLVTFVFTGHVTGLLDAVDPTNDTTPRIGDPFSGSYTVDANHPLQFTNGGSSPGAFEQTEPGIAADLEIHNLSYSLPTPDDRNYLNAYILIAPSPTQCWIVIGYFAEPRTIPDPDEEGHMDLYWNLTDPVGPVPTAQELATVPPVLSNWTQGPAAVSIELKGTVHSDYVADGVIDTIVAQ